MIFYSKNLFTKINTLIFLIWIQFIAFTISIIISSYIIKLTILPFSKLLNIEVYDGIRMSIIFLFATLIQYLLRIFILKFNKLSLYAIVILISSQAITTILIKNILTKTVLSKYQLSYLGIFLCLFIPFYELIVSFYKNR
ncbi:MAG: hypothetical protein N2Z20_04565 [Elusimicrobiales bacterium]|nr:hypothetical protein [Elusimicrobiales bacterium]